MFVGVAEAVPIADVATGLARFFKSQPGVTFLSDVTVMRSEYFATARSDP